MDDLMATAYHEAGHCVVAHRLGVEICAVRIDPANFTGGSEIQKPEDFRDHVTVLLAGGRAEYRYDPSRKKTSRGTGSDNRRILTCLGRHADPSGMGDIDEKDRKVEQWDAELAARCQKIINEDWRAVEALAAELFAKHTITGARARTIIEEALT